MLTTSAWAGRWASMRRSRGRLAIVLRRSWFRRRSNGCCGSIWLAGGRKRICERGLGGTRTMSCAHNLRERFSVRLIAICRRDVCHMELRNNRGQQGEDFAMRLLPIFLKLEGRRCLLVGAGNVALDKIGSLLKAGVRLRVVAPEARDEVRQLAREGKLEWIERRFEASGS